MDHPIYGMRYTGFSDEETDIDDDEEEEEYKMYKRLNYNVTRDDKDGFLRLIKEPRFKQARRWFEAEVGALFESDALNCVIAVLDGEAKGVIDMEDTFKYGLTPIHLAAHWRAVRLMRFFIERGDNVNVCFKQATPIELALGGLDNGSIKPVFALLSRLCFLERARMEVIRLLLGKTRNRERVRDAFIEYAKDGKLERVCVLFLAAPDLFFSSVVMLYHEFNKSGKYEDERRLCQLLEVFAIVGDKLVAYVRLQQTYEQNERKTNDDISFLIRDVAREKKLGVASADYFFRFFKAPRTGLVDNDDEEEKETYYEKRINSLETEHVISELSLLVSRKKFNKYKDDIYRRVLPSMESEAAGRLNRAIDKKISLMSTLQRYFEDMRSIALKEVNHPRPQRYPSFSEEESFKKNVIKTGNFKSNLLVAMKMAPRFPSFARLLIR